MNQFLQTVKQGLSECLQRIETETPDNTNISPPAADHRILIAVSGGADSIALMRALHQLMTRETGKLTHSLIVAHFNHGLRGEASDADAEWLETECNRFEIPFITEKQELNLGKTDKGSEEVYRKARYDFLTQTAQKHQCALVAVAHTSNDQAETVLHHIVRGTGIAGLKGIPRIRFLQNGIFLIRPMLELSREEVLDYLKYCAQEYRQDESNADLRFTRNRIRHQLIPFLKKEFNTNVVPAVNRLSQQADEVSTLISEQANQILKAATLDQNQEIWRLDCDVLKEVPDYITRECFLKIWNQMNWSRKRMGFDHWQRLLELSRSGQKLNLPDGIEAERRERLLILRKLEINLPQ